MCSHYREKSIFPGNANTPIVNFVLYQESFTKPPILPASMCPISTNTKTVDDDDDNNDDEDVDDNDDND